MTNNECAALRELTQAIYSEKISWPVLTIQESLETQALSCADVHIFETVDDLGHRVTQAKASFL